MNLTPSQQRLLIATAWVGTAFAAYSVGSLHSTPAAADGKTTLPAAGTAAAIGGGTGPERMLGGGGRPFEEAHDAGGRSLNEIVNGQPLEEYLQRVLALEDEIKRASAFLELLGALNTPEDIQMALDTIGKSGRGWGRGASSREYSMLLQKWTLVDPRGAAEYASKIPNRDGRAQAMNNVLRTWTRQDTSTALAWAQANGVPAGNTPEEKQRAAAEGNYAVAMVVNQLAATNLDLALSVAAADGDTRASTRLADDLANELYKQRGEQGAREGILAMPQSKLRDAMIGEHADQLAKIDSPGAAQWAATLPFGGGRSRALAEAIAEWAENDPGAAGTFLNTLPPSSDSDAARERFARNVFDKDPMGALSWAATITDPGDRQQTSERLVRSWIRRDAESARLWVQQSPFPEEIKQRMLAPPSNHRGRN